MKIFEMYRDGRLIRFYLCEDSLSDFYCGDWDDTPNESNAGTAYDE
ncbi:MAG: hypothetical protein LBU32_01705 [Clostridiales bacterium]|jgi:hypothetical protein|nr:hypothetical protein [Clostridiales bacterium]